MKCSRPFIIPLVGERLFRYFVIMKKKLKERLKDCVVDHVFVTGYEKMFKRVEMNQDGTRMWYGPVEKKFVQLFKDEKGDELEPNFSSRLSHRKLKVNAKSMNTCLVDLIVKGYLVEGAPIHEEYGLTVKGVNHYQTGRSFEELYLKDRMARIALGISIGSAFVALFSALKAFAIF